MNYPNLALKLFGEKELFYNSIYEFSSKASSFDNKARRILEISLILVFEISYSNFWYLFKLEFFSVLKILFNFGSIVVNLKVFYILLFSWIIISSTV